VLALPPYLIETILEQFTALLPEKEVEQPLGCHRIPRTKSSLRWRAGKGPVDRGKQGLKRSTVVDARGIPLGVIAIPASRHDSPLLGETLHTLEKLGALPEQMSVHLDRGYDSETTRKTLDERGLIGVTSEKGNPAPLPTGNRWIVEHAHSWHNAFKTPCLGH
jgi:Transposase DDE domain